MKSLRLLAFICGLSILPATVGAQTGDIELQLTVGTDLSDGACAASTSVEADYGQRLNLCYRMINNTDQTLRLQVLRDDYFTEYDEFTGIRNGTFVGVNVAGRLMTLTPIELPPGAVHQVNRIIWAWQTRTINADWRALVEEPGYERDEFLINPGPGDPGTGSQFHRPVIDIGETGEELEGLNELWPRFSAELPFEFEFYGLPSKQLVMSEYGTISWDMASTRHNAMSNNPQNLLIRLGPSMMPFWTDMFSSGGRFLFQVVGEAPRRRAIVQWNELKYHSGQFPESDTVTFQLVLEESSNRLYFHYFDMEFGDPAFDFGRASTIGINSGSPVAISDLYSRLEASLNNQHVIRYTPQPLTAFDATAGVHLDVGQPMVDVQPAALDATVSPGAAGNAVLAIANPGTRELNWNLADSKDVPPPPSNAQIPGYAWMATTFGSLVTFDLAAPENGVTFINEDGLGRVMHGGDFVDNDFSRLHTFDWNSSQLHAIDTVCANCGTQFVGNLSCPNPSAPSGSSGCPGEWDAAAYDPTTGWMYMVGDANGGRSALYRVDPADTGELQIIGMIHGVEANAVGAVRIHTIAISPEGRMYGVEALTDNLVIIDKISGRAEVVGNLGIELLPPNWRPPMAMDFDDATGALYLTVKRRLYRVSLETGQAVDLGEVSPLALDAFAIATYTPCTHPDDVPWLSLDQVGGNVPAGEQMEVSVSYQAGGLAPGLYSMTLCLDNDDPLRGRAIVPVTLHVQ